MLRKFILAVVFIVFAGSSAAANDSSLQQIADALDVSTAKTFQLTGELRLEAK
jgi:hypothetical protein